MPSLSMLVFGPGGAGAGEAPGDAAGAGAAEGAGAGAGDAAGAGAAEGAGAGAGDAAGAGEAAGPGAGPRVSSGSALATTVDVAHPATIKPAAASRAAVATPPIEIEGTGAKYLIHVVVK
ncbi:hypothetical protein CKJ56_11760 [Mycobacterium intracellulare subsp. chimaera]|nr:hypothetical protein CE197_13775 [Mycobacterium intracellulare subsp. chimaera]ASX00690.1 hypothetical protein CKJ58_12775 [Mycobacterium intracellulare subsp. chimaera]PBA55683.1 hypothetical protein CKJ57_13910 [Mycobacterium intracellulare subsp. chimaera]PBA63461.1 hypothetical protein CKJ56_11760 [Mycobacterium intracellulare subsp. chimaera]